MPTAVRGAPLELRAARSIYRATAIILAVLTLAFALCMHLTVGGATTARTISDFGLTGSAYFGALMCYLRSRRLTGRSRWSWRLIAAGACSWGLGQTVGTWYDSVLHEPVPLPSLADVGYLGMPILTAAGLLVSPIAAQSRANRVRSVLDGLMVSTALLLISYLVVLSELIKAGADSPLALVVSLAYPVSDTVIVTIVLFILARGRHGLLLQSPVFLVGLGLVTFAVSDSGFAYLSLSDSYNSGSTIDAGWFAGFLLIGLAALRPLRSSNEAAAETPSGRGLGIMVPYVVVVAAIVIGTVSTLHQHKQGQFVFWDRSLLILFMVGRQMLTLLENRGLTRHLESRVEARTAQLRASEQRFEALVQHSSDVVTVMDVEGIVTYQSESLLRVFGLDPHVVVGRSVLSLFDPTDHARLREAIDSVPSRPLGTVTVELSIEHADGRMCRAEMTITNLLDDANVGALVCNTRDVTESRELERQLVHEAFHDTLTGLANRALFIDRVEHELRRRERDENPIAVLFLDLDGFKEINDSLGHAAGDRVLVEVAARLSSSVRVEDSVARFGGDEFAVLVSSTSNADDSSVEEIAERALAAIAEPIDLDGNEMEVTASMGIAYSGPDAADSGQLMRNADLAMYRTKSTGLHGYTRYHPDMHSELVGRLELAAEMRRGLTRDEFTIHYQPSIDLVTGEITGFEALARWNHPQRGNVSPIEFIPLAETTGMICQLGSWILQEATRQAYEWSEREQRPVTVSVNVSGRQLDQPDFVDIVRSALASSGLNPDSLCLEMTESVLLDDRDSVLETLNELKALGLHLAIDDFGTGYSSLSYLNRYPFDVLKIDKSFVDRLQTTGGEATLARTIVQLGEGLGVRTVAEGLEHYEQYLALRRMGCDLGQGFYFSRPVAAVEAGQLLIDDGTSRSEPPKLSA